MIQQALSGLTTFMLVKFILNDVPHAVGLLEHECTTLNLKPAYDLEGGEYPWRFISVTTPYTAQSAVMYASVLEGREGRRLLPLGALRWRYVKMPVGEIDGFVRTLAKYVKYSGDGIKRLMSTFPLGDYFELAEEAEVYRSSWPYLSRPQKEEMTRSFKHALLRDVDRAQGLWKQMRDEGVYWPPILIGNEVIDGAHRLAALRGFCGSMFRVYVWEGRQQ